MRLSPLRCPGQNGKPVINLRKAENNVIAALKVRTIENSKSLLEFPTIAGLLLLSKNAFNDTELLKAYLARWNKIINFCSQNNRKRHG